MATLSGGHAAWPCANVVRADKVSWNKRKPYLNYQSVKSDGVCRIS
jgi:hypothetical protein